MKSKLFLLLTVFSLVSSLAFAGESSYSYWEKTMNDALIFYQKQQYQQAIAVTQEALKFAEQKFGPDSLQVAASAGDLAALYVIQGKTAEAKNLTDKARAIRKKHDVTGTRVGIATEEFFNKAAEGKAKIAERQNEPEPQRSLDRDPRDLNRDGKVNNKDLISLKQSLGKCQKDFKHASDVLADVDGDGCITFQDQKILFPDK